MKVSRRKLVESLVSLRTNAGVTLHAYVIDNKDADAAIHNELCAIADEQNWPYLPVILQTRLTSGGNVVRKILNQSEKTRDAIQRALNGTEKYARTIFMIATGCDDDVKLMELH